MRSWDNAGNSALATYGPLCFDNIPPVTTISLSGNLQQNGSYNGPVLVTLSATDNASGVATTYYAVDSGQFQPYSAPFYVYVPGFHQITAYSVDFAGNVEQYVFTTLTIQQNQQFAVTISKAGTGSGTVTSIDGSINCGSTCSANYWDGEPVTLTAFAGAGLRLHRLAELRFQLRLDLHSHRHRCSHRHRHFQRSCRFAIRADHALPRGGYSWTEQPVWRSVPARWWCFA